MMKFLSLKITNSSKHALTNEVCEEYKDLYKDEDFLEILNMSSEQIKDEIHSYDEDPDEVLARIKGRLENKVIPLIIKKDNEKIKTENIFNLLFSLVNKKITDDIFTENKKNKKNLISRFKSIYLINTVPTAIIAVFSTIIIMESNIILSSKPIEKEILFATEGSNQSNNRILSKYLLPNKAQGNSDIIDRTRYFSQLVGVSPNEINTYSLNNMKNSIIKTNISYSSYLFLEDIYKQNININNQLQRKERPIYLSSLVAKKHDIKKMASIGKDKNKELVKIVASIKNNNSIFSFKKKYKFKINSLIAVRKLPSLINGEKIQLTLENNTLIKVGYIKKDSAMLEIALNGNNIEEAGSKKYYIDHLLLIHGTVKKDQNIYSIVRNQQQFKEGKNREIANLISNKIGKYMANKDIPIIFGKIYSGSDFYFSIDVGIDPETKKIASFRSVKKAYININVASRQ